MPKFNYVAMDARGKETKGVLEVGSQADAINRLKEMGFFPTKVMEAEKPKEKKASKGGGGGGVGVGAGEHVSDVDAAVVRSLAARLLGHVGEVEARRGVDGRGVGGEPGGGAGLPEAGNGGVD